ncbi:hypothetical protein FQN54_002539 [Arachnomyces sp. PD_36]|nr:hypothetical protein FQN54_002539 [Arachnomyces sp. PD_36]
MSDIVKYTVVKKTAPNSSVPPVQPNTSEYTYVASAIKMAMAIVSSNRAKVAMLDIALRMNENLETPIYKGNPQAQARQSVSQFLDHLKVGFPVVVIDQTLTNPDTVAYHARGEFTPPFRPETQGIWLNGPRVTHMVESGENHGIPSRRKWFQIFQFMFAVAIAHEIGGHLFVTFITQGRPITPPNITAPGYGGQQSGGESGRAFESALFGGCVEFYRNSTLGDVQPGIPHILGPDLQSRKIADDTIDSVTSYDVHTPFKTIGNPVSAEARISMGAGQPLPANVGPNARHFLAAARTIPHKFAISIEELERVPQHPEIRALSIAA